MATSGKLETEVQIKAPADKFYKIFSSQAHHIPKISDDIHGIEVHEGDWESPGSVKQWNYKLDEESLSLKETVEVADDEKKLVTFNVLEGEILKHYKSVKTTVQAFDKDGGCLVKWTLEYEKIDDAGPTPDSYLLLASKLTQDIEAHLLKG